MTELRFGDRVAIVTGAGRGVGRSHALLLAAKGARVVVADYGVDVEGGGSSAAPADDVAGEIIENGGEAVACFANVADEESAASVVATALDNFGRLDVIINNAGISMPCTFDISDAAHFRVMMDVHFFGTLFVTRAAWPHFVHAGYGRVVNTVSEAMLGGLPELTSYGAAKGAVFGLTRTLATEAAPHGIRVNAIAPRAYTRMAAASSDKLSEWMSIPKEALDEINANMPPDLCAPGAVFLAHESCPLNGEVLQIGIGGVARLAMVHTQGIWKSPLTAEDVAENLDTILDVADARVTTSDSVKM